MHERYPESTDLDEINHNQTAALVDKLGISWVDARSRLGLQDVEEPTPTRQQSMQLHPSAFRRRHPNNSRPPVGEDSQDVMTGILSDEQVEINSRGIALAREVLKLNQTELTPQERAIARAKREKRARGF